MLRLQRFLCLINLIWTGPLIWFIAYVILGYRCAEPAALRARMKLLLERSRGRPLLICANHLTKVDSILLILFLFSLRQILTDFRKMPWNVPEASHVRANPFYTLFCYLGKCIPIQRSGSSRQKGRTMAKVTALLQAGEYLCIFPEGRRSRSGRLAIDQAVYGVGRLLMRVPTSQVLCVYLRADRGKGFGNFPKWGSHFYWDVDLINPVTTEPGMRGTREMTQQIMARLKRMEDDCLGSSMYTQKESTTPPLGQRYCEQK